LMSASQKVLHHRPVELQARPFFLSDPSRQVPSSSIWPEVEVSAVFTRVTLPPNPMMRGALTIANTGWTIAAACPPTVLLFGVSIWVGRRTFYSPPP
jgi:hypothetical protein